MKKISFIVPVYGVEKYIHQCVDSILDQTFRDFELILVDDGSPDNCGRICDEYANKDSRIIVIHKQNAGVSAARNTGIEHASGEWAYFVDSDDWIEPDAAEKLYHDAIRTGADCVMSDCMICYENGEKKRIHQFSKSFITSSRKEIEAIQKYMLCHKFSPHYAPDTSNGYAAPWGKFVKMSIIRENNIRFDPYAKGVFDDGVYSLYLLDHVNTFYYNDEHTYNYRIVGSSLTHAYKPAAMEIMQRNFKLVDQFIVETKKDESFRQAEHCRIVSALANYLSKYFFNPHNPNSHKDVVRELKQTIKSEPYRTALRSARSKYLEAKHVYIALCGKIGFAPGMELYAKLKLRLKKA